MSEPSGWKFGGNRVWALSSEAGEILPLDLLVGNIQHLLLRAASLSDEGWD